MLNVVLGSSLLFSAPKQLARKIIICVAFFPNSATSPRSSSSLDYLSYLFTSDNYNIVISIMVAQLVVASACQVVGPGFKPVLVLEICLFSLPVGRGFMPGFRHIFF